MLQSNVHGLNKFYHKKNQKLITYYISDLNHLRVNNFANNFIKNNVIRVLKILTENL